MSGFSFNQFPAAAPQAAPEDTAETPDQKQGAPAEQAAPPAESTEQPAAEPKKAPVEDDSSAEATEKKAPAKKTAAKKAAPKRKAPAKKTTKSGGDTDLDAAVDSLISAAQDALGQVSPSAVPIDVYRSLDHLTTALGADTMKQLTAMVDKASALMGTYETFIVNTSEVDEDGNGSFDGYSIADGQVVLDD